MERLIGVVLLILVALFVVVTLIDTVDRANSRIRYEPKRMEESA